MILSGEQCHSYQPVPAVGNVLYIGALRFLKITDLTVRSGYIYFPNHANIREHSRMRDNSLAVGQELPKLLARVRFPVIA